MQLILIGLILIQSFQQQQNTSFTLHFFLLVIVVSWYDLKANRDSKIL